MIDIENIVINTIKTALTTAGETADLSSDYNPTPLSMPSIQVYEASNTAYEQSFDEYLQDHHVNVMYVVEVYALSKAKAKQLRDIVDTAMQSMKFTRNYSAPTFNVDRTIKRYTSRYVAVVGELKDNKYQMFRS